MRRKFGIVMAIGFGGMPQRCNYFSLFVKDEKTTVNLKCEHIFFLRFVIARRGKTKKKFQVAENKLKKIR